MTKEELEKDAKEYAINTRTQKEIKVLNTVQDWGSESLSPEERHLWEGMDDREVAREQGFKDGAEFGYNKAKEWHFVKDGKYPTDEKDVEVLYQDCDKINVYNCVYDIHAENWLYYNLDDMVLERFPFNVIAWKEIVLPELKESK